MSTINTTNVNNAGNGAGIATGNNDNAGSGVMLDIKRGADIVLGVGTMPGETEAAMYDIADHLGIRPPTALNIDAVAGAPPALLEAVDAGLASVLSLTPWNTLDLAKVLQRPHTQEKARLLGELRESEETSRFGAGGCHVKADALVIVNETEVRGSIRNALANLVQREAIAQRKMNGAKSSIEQGTLGVHMVLNLGGAMGAGSGIDVAEMAREEAAKQGFSLRLHLYLVTPTTRNGGSFDVAAAGAIHAIRQMLAASHSLKGIFVDHLDERKPLTAPLFSDITLVTPANGNSADPTRRGMSGQIALDVLLRGDNSFQENTLFVNLSVPQDSDEVGPRLIRRHGATVIEYSKVAAVEGLAAAGMRMLVQRMINGVVNAPVTPLPTLELTTMVEVSQSVTRPNGMDILSNGYTDISNHRRDHFLSIVQFAGEALDALNVRYAETLGTVATQQVAYFRRAIEQWAPSAVIAAGISTASGVLAGAIERLNENFRHYEIKNPLPKLDAEKEFTTLIDTLAELKKLADGAWFPWRYSGAMRETAGGAIDAAKRLFEARIAYGRLAAVRTMIDGVVAACRDILANLHGAEKVLVGMKDAADMTVANVVARCIPLDFAGITVPTGADLDVMKDSLLRPKLQNIVEELAPHVVAGNAKPALAIMAREVAQFDLASKGVIGFLETVPNSHDLPEFARTRLDEAALSAPIDQTVAPNYRAPILRIIRSAGASNNVGPLLDLLRRTNSHGLTSIHDVPWENPDFLIVEHVSQFTAAKEVSYLRILEDAARKLSPALIPYLTPNVANPSDLDMYAFEDRRDPMAGWPTLCEGLASGVIRRGFGHSYEAERAYRETLNLAATQGRIEQGIEALAVRFGQDLPLRRAVRAILVGMLTIDGRNKLSTNYLKAISNAADFVPKDRVIPFQDTLGAVLRKMFPGAGEVDAIARIVGYGTTAPVQAEKPVISHNPAVADTKTSANTTEPGITTKPPVITTKARTTGKAKTAMIKTSIVDSGKDANPDKAAPGAARSSDVAPRKPSKSSSPANLPNALESASTSSTRPEGMQRIDGDREDHSGNGNGNFNGGGSA